MNQNKRRKNTANKYTIYSQIIITLLLIDFIYLTFPHMDKLYKLGASWRFNLKMSTT